MIKPNTLTNLDQPNSGAGQGEPAVIFDGGADGQLVVYRACPNCRRFISAGQVQINVLLDLKFTGWKCSKCGEVRPNYAWE